MQSNDPIKEAYLVVYLHVQSSGLICTNSLSIKNKILNHPQIHIATSRYIASVLSFRYLFINALFAMKYVELSLPNSFSLRLLNRFKYI